MHRLTIPGIFWRDHLERCEDHPGERRTLYNGYKRAIVELDDEAVDDLKSDAEHYSDGVDDCDRSLVLSARSMVKSLARQLS